MEEEEEQLKALRKKERQNETQVTTTKIDCFFLEFHASSNANDVLFCWFFLNLSPNSGVLVLCFSLLYG
jgi:hypothetical protein